MLKSYLMASVPQLCPKLKLSELSFVAVIGQLYVLIEKIWWVMQGSNLRPAD